MSSITGIDMKRKLLLSLLLVLIPAIAFGGMSLKLADSLKLDSGSASWTPASATTVGSVTALHWYSPSHANFQDSARTTAVSADDVTGSATDKMAAADHLSQATTNNKPVYKVNILNGKPMWLFDGTNDFVQGAFVAAINQPCTAIVVVKLDSTFVNDNSNHIAIDKNAGPTSTAIWKNGTPTPDAWTFSAGTAVNGGAADATTHIFAGVFNGASSVLYKDGVSEASGNIGASAFSGLTIGTSYEGTFPWKGYIGDTLICPGALVSADLNQYGNFLADFYGTTWTTIP